MRPLSVRAITSSFVLRACANHVSSYHFHFAPMRIPCVFNVSPRHTPSCAAVKEYHLCDQWIGLMTKVTAPQPESAEKQGEGRGKHNASKTVYQTAKIRGSRQAGER